MLFLSCVLLRERMRGREEGRRERGRGKYLSANRITIPLTNNANKVG